MMIETRPPVNVSQYDTQAMEWLNGMNSAIDSRSQ